MDIASQEQRKRALKALERRFALAKGEYPKQQNRKTNDSPVQDRALNYSLTPRKLSFWGHESTGTNPDETGLAYSMLSHSVHENLLASSIEDTRGSIVNKISHELLQSGDTARKYLQGSKHLKIDNWILLDTLVKPRTRKTHAKDTRAHLKCPKNVMSMKRHKDGHSSLDLPQHLQKYDVFKPIHERWKEYMMQLLKNSGKKELESCLLTADLHGAFIGVVDCKVRSYTGICGIMARETAETFGLITKYDKLRVVPKKCSVFVFEIDCWKVTLYGDKLCSRCLAT